MYVRIVYASHVLPMAQQAVMPAPTLRANITIGHSNNATINLNLEAIAMNSTVEINYGNDASRQAPNAPQQPGAAGDMGEAAEEVEVAQPARAMTPEPSESYPPAPPPPSPTPAVVAKEANADEDEEVDDEEEEVVEDEEAADEVEEVNDEEEEVVEEAEFEMVAAGEVDVEEAEPEQAVVEANEANPQPPAPVPQNLWGLGFEGRGVVEECLRQRIFPGEQLPIVESHLDERPWMRSRRSSWFTHMRDGAFEGVGQLWNSSMPLTSVSLRRRQINNSGGAFYYRGQLCDYLTILQERAHEITVKRSGLAEQPADMAFGVPYNAPMVSFHGGSIVPLEHIHYGFLPY